MYKLNCGHEMQAAPIRGYQKRICLVPSTCAVLSRFRAWQWGSGGQKLCEAPVLVGCGVCYVCCGYEPSRAAGLIV